ncbi:MAG TPA: hypothetical protein VHM01_16320 [Alphaproteobacteria bacterium]|nr:hypothetical protein [Alphaproteobacteria bacterium]
MEPTDLTTIQAAEAAVAAYRAARRSRASRNVADDVALARFRAYFPLATESDWHGAMREHLSHKRAAQRRAIKRTRLALALSVSN